MDSHNVKCSIQNSMKTNNPKNNKQKSKSSKSKEICVAGVAD